MTISERTLLLTSRLAAVRYMHFVNLTIFVFDYCLTLNEEKTLMWSSRWSISKILFFCTRYSPAFDVPVLLYSSLASNLSFERCSQLQEVTSWGTLFGMAAAEAILILRTYALSGRNRGVLVFFSALWTMGVIAAIVVTQLFLESAAYGAPPSPQIPGCFLTKGNAIFPSIGFGVVLLFDTSIMAYTLWIWLSTYRCSSNKLVVTLYRDGFTYYMLICIISSLNVATLLNAPVPTNQLFNTFLRVVHSILSARILLHARNIQRLDSERTMNSLARRVTLSFATPNEEDEL
ncbi:hypothetical protein B0H16DRAFT_973865 [Mycena metata]|uniref:DUF6533 domain-containing protein n=1 Tax=Mycena metata TaxID=1033252 RepID=A0AAD7N502_9AGAR|nr:hypothetical protein B0H16DRAFT_973865 [Mycena metata]